MAEETAIYTGRKATFDTLAETYETFRPSYPEALVDTIVELSGLNADSRLVEIGSGTGLATARFAQRGFSILCLEPGGNMAAVAARKFQDNPRITIENTTFEEWNAPPDHFDLIFAAQSFHWINPEVGYARAAHTLKPQGSLALFWNTNPLEAQDALFAEIQEVYQQRAPEMVQEERSLDEWIAARLQPIVDSGFFDSITTHRFPWTAEYDGETYTQMLGTHSNHAVMSPPLRTHLYAGIEAVIRRNGNRLPIHYVTVLYHAHKAAKS